MIENIKRFREPTAWVIIGVTVASLLLALVRFVVILAEGNGGIRAASQDFANSAMNLTLVALVVAAVCACLFALPSTPHVAAVARAAAVVVSLGTLLTLVATVAGVTASAGTLGVFLEAFGGLLDIVLKIVGCVVLWLVVRGASPDREGVPAVTPPGSVELGTELLVPNQPPVWKPSEASGSVWHAASDAAHGDPAAGHGQPGSGSWHRVDPPAS